MEKIPLPQEEFTLVLLKPDAVERNIEFELISTIKKLGYRPELIAKKHISIEDFNVLYGILQEECFFHQLKERFLHKELVFFIIVGKGLVDQVNTIVGEVDPSTANKGTIRNLFGLDIMNNTIHSSKSHSVAINEFKVLYNDCAIIEY